MKQLLNKKAIELLQQGLNIARWINKFNPEHIDKEYKTLPKDLRAYQDRVNYTIDDLDTRLVNSSFRLAKKTKSKSHIRISMVKLNKYFNRENGNKSR